MTNELESHWIVHTGEKYTDGSFLGFYYRTKEETQKKLDEIRNSFNISEVEGKYEE